MILTEIFIGENCEQNMCGLTDKNGRAQWERDFVGRYISPVLDVCKKNLLFQCFIL